MRSIFVFEQFPLANYLLAKNDGIVKRHRIYIMPTRQGFVFTLVLLAMLLGAVNYNNSMAYILTFLLCSLFLITILHTYKNLAGITINEAPVSNVFVDDMAEFPLIVDNRGQRLRLSICFLKVADNPWAIRSIVPDARLFSYHIAPDSLECVSLTRKAVKRGALKAGRVKVYTTFPLGLFIAWSYINMQQSCLIYPHPAGNKSLPPSKLSGVAGMTGSTAGADDFKGLRNYRPGDSIKNIVWKIYAQQKGMLIKEFNGYGSNKLKLGWDDVAHMTDIEMKLSQLCLWVITADSKSFEYSLELPNMYVAGDHGEKHLHYCLSCIARYGLAEA